MKKIKRVTILMTEDEFSQIEKICEKGKRTISDYIRDCLFLGTLKFGLLEDRINNLEKLLMKAYSNNIKGV